MTNVSVSDLIITCIDLVKDQIDILVTDIRKMFFANLTTLIEKSPDPRLLKSLTEVTYPTFPSQKLFFVLVNCLLVSPGSYCKVSLMFILY